HVEPLVAAWPVDAAQVDQDLETAAAVVPQQLQHRHNLLRVDVERQLAEPYIPPLQGRAELAFQILAKLFQRFSLSRHVDLSPPPADAAASALDGAGAADLPLQQEHAVKQRLRGWRAAGHVDIDRNDAVAAAHDCVG